MKHINQEIKTFIHDLQSGAAEAIPFWKKFFTTKEQHWLQIGESFIKTLDQLETTPIFFSSEQEIDYPSYQFAGSLILEKLKAYQSEAVRLLAARLQQRLLSQLYRLEGQNGGYDKESVDVKQLRIWTERALAWKHRQELLPHKELNDEEIDKLKEITRYSHMAELLLREHTLIEEFFVWIIRDQNDVAPYVEFPGMRDKLIDSMLSGRIGRIGGYHLKIEKTDKKTLTLPFEGDSINILDQNARYTFRGGYTLTIAEVFTIFHNKFKEAGNLEFLAEGIINWNYLKLGYWDSLHNHYQLLSVEQETWWEELPVFEVLTLQQARRRYGQHMDGYTWNVALTASRGSATLDYEKTHAYLDLARPLGAGKYAIYDFGKFANFFPTNFMEVLSIFAFNVHASIGYPDENVYYTHRETAHHSFPIAKEEVDKIFSSIREDILTARNYNFVYQIESDNCAKWAQEKIAHAIGEERIPDIFRMRLIDTEPFGPVAGLFTAIRWLPSLLHDWALVRLHLFLGAFWSLSVEQEGEEVKKSLTRHEFWQTGVVFLPARLHYVLERKLIARVTHQLKTILIAWAYAAMSLFKRLVYRIKKWRSLLHGVSYDVNEQKGGGGTHPQIEQEVGAFPLLS